MVLEEAIYRRLGKLSVKTLPSPNNNNNTVYINNFNIPYTMVPTLSVELNKILSL